MLERFDGIAPKPVEFTTMEMVGVVAGGVRKQRKHTLTCLERGDALGSSKLAKRL